MQQQTLRWGMTPMQSGLWVIAYNAGFDAQQREVSRFDNPHREGTAEYNGWKRGWDTAAMAKRMMRYDTQF